MPKTWTIELLTKNRFILTNLYVKQNLTISEIGIILELNPSTIYDRLKKCGIEITRNRKPGFNNQRTDIQLPRYNEQLSEFIGILLGDGNITKTQVVVTLGLKESFHNYVASLISTLFQINPKVLFRKNNYIEVYFGSISTVRWLKKMGLAHNKVKAQVSIPRWCFRTKALQRACLRGLFDTDGSIYKLRSGVQMSLTNKSQPLLKDAKSMLEYLGYSPSRISANKIYLTKKADIQGYIDEIGFKNPKHKERARIYMGGSYSGNYI